MTEKIAVVGLGYVGLPVAVGMARAHGSVAGFDIDARRIADLRRGTDVTGELAPEELAGLALHREGIRALHIDVPVVGAVAVEGDHAVPMQRRTRRGHGREHADGEPCRHTPDRRSHHRVSHLVRPRRASW